MSTPANGVFLIMIDCVDAFGRNNKGQQDIVARDCLLDVTIFFGAMNVGIR